MGLDNDNMFGANKGGAAKKQFKAPEKVEKADAKDPQYEVRDERERERERERARKRER